MMNLLVSGFNCKSQNQKRKRIQKSDLIIVPSPIFFTFSDRQYTPYKVRWGEVYVMKALYFKYNVHLSISKYISITIFIVHFNWLCIRIYAMLFWILSPFLDLFSWHPIKSINILQIQNLQNAHFLKMYTFCMLFWWIMFLHTMHQGRPRWCWIS